MKRIIIALLLLSFALSFAACAQDEPKNTGVLADSDTVASIKKELEDRENSLLSGDGDVFWTASGSIWHATYKCSYIANSKTVYHGSVEQARLEGKERACDRCFSQLEADKDIWEQLENNEIMTGDVFFSRENTYYHVSEYCTQLSGQKVYHGNRAVALMLEKSQLCPVCGGER